MLRVIAMSIHLYRAEDSVIFDPTDLMTRRSIFSFVLAFMSHGLILIPAITLILANFPGAFLIWFLLCFLMTSSTKMLTAYNAMAWNCTIRDSHSSSKGHIWLCLLSLASSAHFVWCAAANGRRANIWLCVGVNSVLYYVTACQYTTLEIDQSDASTQTVYAILIHLQ